MNIPTGDELVTLMGLPESDDKILDLFEYMGIKRDEVELDEDTGSFWIGSVEDYGFALEFSDVLPKNFEVNRSIGGNYFIYTNFDYTFHALPYGIEDTDSLEVVERKLGKTANYIDKDDSTKLTWIYEDLGVFIIEFQSNEYKEIINIIINLYENPREWGRVLDPFER